MMQPESGFKFEDDFEDEDVEITELGPNPYDQDHEPEVDTKP